jgi:hypothetical protein
LFFEKGNINTHKKEVHNLDIAITKIETQNTQLLIVDKNHRRLLEVLQKLVNDLSLGDDVFQTLCKFPNFENDVSTYISVYSIYRYI